MCKYLLQIVIMKGKKTSFTWTLLFLGVCFMVWGGLPGVNARLRFNKHFINRERGMHELTAAVKKEYDYNQGFEATLQFVSTSENETFGSDISPLQLTVR